MKHFAILLIIFGMLWCLIGGYYLWMKHNPTRLAFTNYQVTKTQKITWQKQKLQQRIVIKDLGIDLLLIPSQIKENKWGTTNDGASYLTSSPIPGERGNSIIYGHNWANLFGNLIQAKPGQEIEILFSDGKKKTFIIEYTSVVASDQANILAPTDDNRITLYTCTGFLDYKRFVVVAILKDVSQVVYNHTVSN